MVITSMSMVTPYRLPAFKPTLAMRVLLTPTERRRPRIIYLTPGLLASQAIHMGYMGLALRVIRQLFLTDIPGPGSSPRLPENIAWWRIAVYGLITLASTAVLTPLEVRSDVRLIAQWSVANFHGCVS